MSRREPSASATFALSSPDQRDRAHLEIVVSDTAIAKIVAFRVIQTPGVVRLHPRLTRTVTRTAKRMIEGAGRRVTTRAAGGGTSAAPISHDGVEVDRDASGAVTVSVWLILAATPAVIACANRLQHDLAADLQRIAGLEVAVVLHIVDVETTGEPAFRDDSRAAPA